MAVLFSDNTTHTFNGSSGSFHTTNFSLEELATTDFTIESFVKYTGAADRAWSPALGSDATPFSTVQVFAIGKRELVTEININMGGITSGNEYIASTNLFDGSEHHLAIIRDRTSENLRVYVDYTLVRTITGITGDGTSTNTLLLGAVGWDSSERWVGDVGPVRISDTIVSTNEMLGWEPRKITITDLKAPNDANEQVANATDVQVKLWIDKDDVDAPDVLVTDATITGGTMTVNFDSLAAVGDPVLGVAKWTVATDDYFFPIETTVEEDV